jgi:peptidyl-prolyl cis-trans isomerase SurA
MLKRFFVPAALAFGLVAAVPLQAEILEQVLVKVNGDIISLSDFERRQVEALQQQPELAKLGPNSPELARAIASVTPRLILSAVDDLLYLQRARELGWTLTTERFNEIVANIRKANNLEDDAAFRRELAAAGLTEDELRRNIERDLLISQVQRVDVIDKIAVTETEVADYYKANTREFTTPAEVTLREILIAVPTTDRGVNVAQDDEARARAEELRKRLLAGEPFPRLAGEFSSSASKANGGLIGPFQLDDLAPSLQKALGAMKVGDITEVLSTTQGYQILKLESRSDTKVRTLDEARAAVSQRVAQQKSQAELMKYLEKLRAQAKIVWRHEELKKAYNQALAERRETLGLPAPAAPES